MSEWQDISTAPKDGQIIKVRHGKWSEFHVRWKDGAWRGIEFQTAEPTHWLPEPPHD